MTNAVERMYKEYGVKPVYRYYLGEKDDNTGISRKCYNPVTKEKLIENYRLGYPKCKIIAVHKSYPPFTAEKQIELIKYIQYVSDIDHFYTTAYCVGSKDEKYRTGVQFVTEFNNEMPLIIGVVSPTFKDALAELIVKLKLYIDNAKVKEILER